MSDFSVLFVDDEPITRKMSSRLLGRHFQILEAEDGADALDILAQTAASVGVIITDMKMANMDGMTLILRVAEDYPGIPVIASTGDLANYDFASLIGSGQVYSAIEKPWELKQAINLIESAIAHRAQGKR